MPHNNYVRPDGQWPPEIVLTPGDLRRLDVAQFQAVNGDAGGTWVPLTPITIGGASLVLTGGSSLGHVLSGGLLTYSGGRVYLGASIYPSFASTQSRTIDYGLGGAFTTAGVGNLLFRIPPRSLHNGATLASANVTFVVAQKHVVTPAVLPQAIVVRSDWTYWRPFEWTASTPFPAGTLICAAGRTWGYAYVATGAGGTSGSVEPTWTSAAHIGDTLPVDGSVTWFACGFTGTANPWQATHAYTATSSVVQPTLANGLVYQCTATSGSGTSSGTEPTWPLAVGATVIDNPGGNQVVWTCRGSPRAALWVASFAYPQGAIVTGAPDNGLFYTNTHSGGGTSGSSPPTTWGTAVGSSTIDGTCTWLCLGSNPLGAGALAAPASADAYFDGGVPQTMSVPCDGATTIDTAHYTYAIAVYDEAGVGAFQSAAVTPWTKTTSYASFPTFAVSSFILPEPLNGFYFVYASAGHLTTSGTSGSTPPVFPPTIGGFSTLDGTISGWECLGPATPSNNEALSVAFAFTNIADMRPE